MLVPNTLGLSRVTLMLPLGHWKKRKVQMFSLSLLFRGFGCIAVPAVLQEEGQTAPSI